MRVSRWLADNCLLSPDSTIFSALYRGILILSKFFMRPNVCFMGSFASLLFWTDVRSFEATLPPPQTRIKFLTFWHFMRVELNCWSKLWSNFRGQCGTKFQLWEGAMMFVVILESLSAVNSKHILAFHFTALEKQ